LNEQDLDFLDFLKVLNAAVELHLQELIEYLQKYLIENKPEWLEQHFEIIQRTSSQSNNLSELQEFCTNLMVKSPEKFLNHLILIYFPKNLWLNLLKMTICK
jgi:hypothetical protein